MKSFILACLLVATTSAAFLPSAYGSALRQRRDVSELSNTKYNYVPPSERFAAAGDAETMPAVVAIITEDPVAAAASTASEDSAVLGKNGYEYKTVRRIKYRYRQRRDVSHLSSHYLPPTNEYLPPAMIPEVPVGAEQESLEEPIVVAEPLIAREYLPPTTTAAAPAAEMEENKEEQPITEAPATETPETEAPAIEEQAAVTDAPIDEMLDMLVMEQEAPEETAILTKDGYHYKQPEVVPPQLRSADMTEDLPQVSMDEAIIVEGPEESAVLADDGYHYRAIKRQRL